SNSTTLSPRTVRETPSIMFEAGSVQRSSMRVLPFTDRDPASQANSFRLCALAGEQGAKSKAQRTKCSDRITWKLLNGGAGGLEKNDNPTTRLPDYPPTRL